MPLDVIDPVGGGLPSYKAQTRTNLGLGATWLTNTNVTNFRTSIGLGDTSNVTFNSLILGNTGGTLIASPPPPVGSGIYWPTNTFGPYDFYAPAAKVDLIDIDGYIFTTSPNGGLAMYGDFNIYGALKFEFASNAATTRTNLGLGNGITATKTFITTNNVTNTVVISNGIITSWTP